MNKEISKILIAGTEYDIRDSRFKELTELEEQVSANEQARVAAENSRETAETDRADAEAARVEAEQARAEEFAGFTATLAAKEDVANKVTSINAEADDVHYPSAKAVKDSLAKVKNIEVTPDMLSESTKQFINASGGGTITNFADDEDLTTVDNALKLADKTYDPIAYSGMGRKYLRKNLVSGKNILTQEMLPSANTIYIIQYDYDLNGATITIPENCTLDFKGGSLANGTVNGNKTVIAAQLVRIFNSITLGGTFVGSGYPEWYGTIAGQKSVCLIESMASLYNVYDNIELQEGVYYAHSGKSVQCKSLEGKGRKTTISVSGYTDDYCPFILGKLGGSSTERIWNQTIRGVYIELRELDVLRTSCLSIGAATRCLIDNITCWNYAKRSSEFTEDELLEPANYCNYGIVINGSIEISSMTNFVSSGDIGIYFKTSTDIFTMSNGYIECSGKGLAAIYGCPIGTNSSLSNVDLAQGLYGIYSVGGATNYDQGRFLIKNVRIEQLRKLTINNNVVGCNVYLDANGGFISESYIENLGISGATNGFYIKGAIVLSISKVMGSAGTSQNEFDFKIEGNSANLTISEYAANINGGVEVPDGYALEGLASVQLYGKTYLKPKAGTLTKIYVPDNANAFGNRFTSENKCLYRRQYYRDMPTGYINFAVFNTRVQSDIVIAKITITIFANDIYSSAIYIAKFQQDENGNQTGNLSNLTMIQCIGDGIMSDKYEAGKFCLTREEGSPNVAAYNRLGKVVQAVVEFKLYTKGII